MSLSFHVLRVPSLAPPSPNSSLTSHSEESNAGQQIHCGTLSPEVTSSQQGNYSVANQEQERNRRIWKPSCQKQGIRSFQGPPIGISPSEAEQKCCKTTSLSLSMDSGSLPKAGKLITPGPESNTSYPNPTFPCNVWVFAQNKHRHSHTHTHTFSWVKSLTPKQWVLQKLQSNCISWNISGHTARKDWDPGHILSVQWILVTLPFWSQQMAKLWAELLLEWVPRLSTLDLFFFGMSFRKEWQRAV